MWVVAGTVDADIEQFKVSKLFQGNRYLFRVTAENKVGCGPAVELSEPAEAKLPYGENPAAYHVISLYCCPSLFRRVGQNCKPRLQGSITYWGETQRTYRLVLFLPWRCFRQTRPTGQHPGLGDQSRLHRCWLGCSCHRWRHPNHQLHPGEEGCQATGLHLHCRRRCPHLPVQGFSTFRGLRVLLPRPRGEPSGTK